MRAAGCNSKHVDRLALLRETFKRPGPSARMEKLSSEGLVTAMWQWSCCF